MVFSLVFTWLKTHIYLVYKSGRHFSVTSLDAVFTENSGKDIIVVMAIASKNSVTLNSTMLFYKLLKKVIKYTYSFIFL